MRLRLELHGGACAVKPELHAAKLLQQVALGDQSDAQFGAGDPNGDGWKRPLPDADQGPFGLDVKV
jgi:hypothetical protein